MADNSRGLRASSVASSHLSEPSWDEAGADDIAWSDDEDTPQPPRSPPPTEVDNMIADVRSRDFTRRLLDTIRQELLPEKPGDKGEDLEKIRDALFLAVRDVANDLHTERRRDRIKTVMIGGRTRYWVPRNFLVEPVLPKSRKFVGGDYQPQIFFDTEAECLEALAYREFMEKHARASRRLRGQCNWIPLPVEYVGGWKEEHTAVDALLTLTCSEEENPQASSSNRTLATTSSTARKIPLLVLTDPDGDNFLLDEGPAPKQTPHNTKDWEEITGDMLECCPGWKPGHVPKKAHKKPCNCYQGREQRGLELEERKEMLYMMSDYDDDDLDDDEDEEELLKQELEDAKGKRKWAEDSPEPKRNVKQSREPPRFE